MKTQKIKPMTESHPISLSYQYPTMIELLTWLLSKPILTPSLFRHGKATMAKPSFQALCSQKAKAHLIISCPLSLIKTWCPHGGLNMVVAVRGSQICVVELVDLTDRVWVKKISMVPCEQTAVVRVDVSISVFQFMWVSNVWVICAEVIYHCLFV